MSTLDIAYSYESEGRTFESFRARQFLNALPSRFWWNRKRVVVRSLGQAGSLRRKLPAEIDPVPCYRTSTWRCRIASDARTAAKRRSRAGRRPSLRSRRVGNRPSRGAIAGQGALGDSPIRRKLRRVITPDESSKCLAHVPQARCDIEGQRCHRADSGSRQRNCESGA